MGETTTTHRGAASTRTVASECKGADLRSPAPAGPRCPALPRPLQMRLRRKLIMRWGRLRGHFWKPWTRLKQAALIDTDGATLVSRLWALATELRRGDRCALAAAFSRPWKGPNSALAHIGARARAESAVGHPRLIADIWSIALITAPTRNTRHPSSTFVAPTR